MSDAKLAADAFTEMAPQYVETVDRELRNFWGYGYQEFIDRFVRVAHLADGERVLDVGTGTGMIPLKISHLVGATGRVIGVDITPAMLQFGKQNISRAGLEGNVRLVCGSGMAMPLGPGCADVTLCGLATHHMDVALLLAEVRRVLRPGGRFVAADIGASAFWRTALGELWLRLLMIAHGIANGTTRIKAEIDAFPNVRTAEEWRALLLATGFEDISIQELPARRRWYPIGLLIEATARTW